MGTGNHDIRRIRIFLAVVQAGGFSAAQDILGLSQSTISTEIASLETRLGYKLCSRGRTGFRLTPQGEEFLNDAQSLFTAISRFDHSVSRLRAPERHEVRIGVIDNLVSDPKCPITHAIEHFIKTYGDTKSQIKIDVSSPADIESRVISGSLDIGIGIFLSVPRTIQRQVLYSERDVLVCGHNHPLFSASDTLDLYARVGGANKVVRSFLNLEDFFFLSDEQRSITAYVDNIEAAAMIILAGHHIGFLPDHYVKKWVDAGEMHILLEKTHTRKSPISMIFNKDTSHMTRETKTLVEALRSAPSPVASAR